MNDTDGIRHSQPRRLRLGIVVDDESRGADVSTWLSDSFSNLVFEPLVDDGDEVVGDFAGLLVAEGCSPPPGQEALPTVAFNISDAQPGARSLRSAVESLLLRLASQDLSQDFRLLLDELDGSLLLDEQHRCVYADAHAMNLINGAVEDALGASIDRLGEFANTAIEPKIESLDEPGASTSFEVYSQATARWLEISVERLSESFHVRMTASNDQRPADDAFLPDAYRTLFADLPRPTFVLSKDNRVQLWNAQAEREVGWTQEALHGDALPVAETDRSWFERCLADVLEGETVTDASLTLTTPSGDELTVQLSLMPLYVDTEIRGVVGLLSREPTTRHSETLASLHDVVDDLQSEPSLDEITERAVARVTDLVPSSYAAVFLHDDDEDVLSPSASTSGVFERFGSEPAIADGESYLWTQFAEGSERYVPDGTTADVDVPDGTDIRSEFALPLGSHGLLVVGSTTPGAWSDFDRDVLRAFANVLRTALTMQAQRERLDSYEDRLVTQYGELDERSSHLDLLTDFIDTFDDVTSQTGYLRAICDDFVDSADYQFASFYPVEADADDAAAVDVASEPQVWRAAETIDVSTPADLGFSAEFLTKPFVTGDVVVEHYQLSREDVVTTRTPIDVVAVPITYREHRYGTLVLGTDDFDQLTRGEWELLTELVSLVGLSLNTFERVTRRLYTEWQTADVVLGSNSVLSTFVDAFDADVDVTSLTVGPSGALLAGVRTDMPVTQFAARLDDLPWVEPRTIDATDVAAREIHCTLEFPTTSLGDRLDDLEARAQSLAVTDDETTLELQFPETDAALEEHFAGEQLVDLTLTEEDDDAFDGAHIWEHLEGELTDRQYEILCRAVEAGFYEWPRAKSGKEIATDLDISQPTFHHHLRAAERKVFEWLFSLVTGDEALATEE